MATKFHYTLLITFAICSLLSLAQANDSTTHYKVTGTVYCDTCRAKFVTRVSERMPGAKVRLECHNITDEKLVYSLDGETDANGVYTMDAEGEHEDEICGVKPVKSSKEDCNEVIKDGWAKEFTRISLTNKNGMISRIRKVNPILYLRSKRIAICPEVFKELHYIPGDEDLEQP